MIFLEIGLAFHDATRHRPFVDAEFEHHEQMHADEGEEHAGNDENVQREKARQRFAGDDRAAEHKLDELAPNERHAAHDRRADAEPPVGVLIEAHHLRR